MFQFLFLFLFPCLIFLFLHLFPSGIFGCCRVPFVRMFLPFLEKSFKVSISFCIPTIVLFFPFCPLTLCTLLIPPAMTS